MLPLSYLANDLVGTGRALLWMLLSEVNSQKLVDRTFDGELHVPEFFVHLVSEYLAKQ
jgi:hypothetical protein